MSASQWSQQDVNFCSKANNLCRCEITSQRVKTFKTHTSTDEIKPILWLGDSTIIIAFPWVGLQANKSSYLVSSAS
jgi:hypothetical protein